MPLMNRRPPDDYSDIAAWRLWMLIIVLCTGALIALAAVKPPEEAPAEIVTEEEKP